MNHHAHAAIMSCTILSVSAHLKEPSTNGSFECKFVGKFRMTPGPDHHEIAACLPPSTLPTTTSSVFLKLVVLDDET